MYVCICNAITDRQIREAVRDGASSLRQLRTTLSLGRSCGRCVESARQIVAEHRVHPAGGHIPPSATSRQALACQDI